VSEEYAEPYREGKHRSEPPAVAGSRTLIIESHQNQRSTARYRRRF